MEQQYTQHDYTMVEAGTENLVVSAVQYCEPPELEPPAWFAAAYASGCTEQVEKGLRLRDRGGPRLVRPGQWLLQLPELDYLMVMEDDDFRRQFLPLAA